jgi:hypothetical protein
MNLGKKVLIVGIPMCGKSALMSAMAQLLIVDALKKEEVIIIHNSEMSPQDVKNRIELIEDKFQEEDKPKKFTIKPYDLELLPEPVRYFDHDSNPWPGPKGSKKKHWNTSKHKRRL